MDGWIEGWVAAGFIVWMGGLRDRWVDGYMGRVGASALEPCGNSLAKLAGLSPWLAHVTDLLGHVQVTAFGKFPILKAHLCGVFQWSVPRACRPRTRQDPVTLMSPSRLGRPRKGQRPSMGTSTQCGKRIFICE